MRKGSVEMETPKETGENAMRGLEPSLFPTLSRLGCMHNARGRKSHDAKARCTLRANQQ
jgi:hypothetical protein